jgi:hypothetical protein
MQRVGQHVNIGLAPRDELAIEPNEAIAVVKWYWLSHAISPWTFAQRFAT